MDWCSGPLAYILGFPSFWVVRVAKICQLVSGLYIVVEILGDKRVKTISKGLLKLLRQTRVGHRLRNLGGTMAAYLERATGLPLLSTVGLSDHEELTTNAWFPRLVSAFSFILAVAFSGYVTFRISEAVQMAFLGIASTAVFIFLVVGLPGSLAGLIITAYMVEILFRLVEVGIQGVTKLLVGLLTRRPLSYTLLVASFVLFIIGSLLELIAS